MDIIVAGIIACEIGFWIALFAGLALRYLARLRTLSTIVLLLVPILDLLLLALIAWDMLANGAHAEFAHGLGAVYLGFTVSFGHQIIHRVDAWFAHRFADGPKPAKPPRTGAGRVRHEWVQWVRMLLCAVISSAVLGAIILLVGDAARTEELLWWFARVWAVTGIWLIAWPIWVTVQFMSQDEQAPHPVHEQHTP